MLSGGFCSLMTSLELKSGTKDLVSECVRVCAFAEMQSEAATVNKVNSAKPDVLKPHLFP